MNNLKETAYNYNKILENKIVFGQNNFMDEKQQYILNTCKKILILIDGIKKFTFFDIVRDSKIYYKIINDFYSFYRICSSDVQKFTKIKYLLSKLIVMIIIKLL